MRSGVSGKWAKRTPVAFTHMPAIRAFCRTVTGADGTDSVSNVERLQFADGLYDMAGAPIVNTINAIPDVPLLAAFTARAESLVVNGSLNGSIANMDDIVIFIKG